ncbi:hypothetical protein EYZ11_002981 [Aspergillus tanneri]|uniref:Sas10 C-terminal domain-containing protein n=1 Tax=Aspergillus tanneri TaxID=1220188 RepID=A0A4S3JRK3_9EURO|nr:uncharacterized protein ATNIH1004_000911 [Aspergillus tanneri]KAA8652011.1 hypothetical protein ATNIH1004_000911 [Aspergillus tanneri]THC97558.1 hypothetical protein EYZ11_002981 [Aspergillus tanneri]
MAKKRKAGGRPASRNAPAPEKTKFGLEERFDGSEDEFQTGRDQILLEEAPEAKRRRKLVEEEELFQLSDEEVMGYESMDEDDLDDEEELDEDGYDEDGVDDLDEEILGSKSKRRGASGASEDEDEDDIAAWGSSKKDLYNADQIETEADALEEEKEAKRLQQKHLQAMNEGDFGFDETEWIESGKEKGDEEDEAEVVTEVLPQAEITDDMSEEEKLKILKARYPELEPLAKDFGALQSELEKLAQAANAFKTMEANEGILNVNASPVPVIKYRALSAYLGVISLYFMLLTSPANDASEKAAALSPAELRAHPVMGSLVKFRKLWETAKDLNIPEAPGVDSGKKQKDSKTELTVTPHAKKQSKKTKDAQGNKQKKQKQSKAQRAAEAALAEAEAQRADKLRETEANLADLSKLITEPSRKRPTQRAQKSKDADDSDFGDEDALTTKEAEEKAKQKRSLRFYTSQLAQKANKRTAAGRDAGGDADLPYRERLRDRQARLNAEAEKRGRQQPKGSEQLGGDSDDEDRRVANELRGEQSGTGDDEYYDMVAARTNKRKEDKKALAEAHVTAARQGGHVEIQEEIGPDGKRAITYQIEKNKGLAPKRNKDSRNPRVKKRKRYEDKKKKLASVRQIYKGGEGRGGYGGELTGIKKNLVKSVKL